MTDKPELRLIEAGWWEPRAPAWGPCGNNAVTRGASEEPASGAVVDSITTNSFSGGV
jgi:hypothetical protein